jgi:hypothetical protein
VLSARYAVISLEHQSPLLFRLTAILVNDQTNSLAFGGQLIAAMHCAQMMAVIATPLASADELAFGGFLPRF